jgi:hypothetical protein
MVRSTSQVICMREKEREREREMDKVSDACLQFERGGTAVEEGIRRGEALPRHRRRLAT